MAKLIYSMMTSLDGHVSGPDGSFGWGGPADDELHEFVNQRARSIGTYLYGRRMYETMVYWETAHTQPDQPRIQLDWARIWQAADKVVYSTTMTEVASERTRIERAFDPEVVRQLKADSDHDIDVSGPHLAAQALRAGLVDELQLFVGPAVVGGGNRFYPDGVQLDLELRDVRRFGGSGFVYLRYAAG